MDYLALHQAYVRGDLAALQSLLGYPADFPHTRSPDTGESCLEYALYHSPLPLIRTLLELGADPNDEANDGFPSLIAVLSSDRPDKKQVLSLLLSFGANIQQRGVNDYTPLHYAACQDDPSIIELLLEQGADPDARTRIDHYATPLEEAEQFGHSVGAETLRRFLANKKRL
jgi:ankyrin repeat protein